MLFSCLMDQLVQLDMQRNMIELMFEQTLVLFKQINDRQNI